MKTYKFKINGKDYDVTIGEAEGKTLQVNVNGADYQVELENAPASAPAAAAPAAAAPAAATPAPAAPAAPKAPAGAGEKVNSPLPGVIVEVSVKEGQAVKSVRTESGRTGSHEDGERNFRAQGRYHYRHSREQR